MHLLIWIMKAAINKVNSCLTFRANCSFFWSMNPMFLLSFCPECPFDVSPICSSFLFSLWHFLSLQVVNPISEGSFYSVSSPCSVLGSRPNLEVMVADLISVNSVNFCRKWHLSVLLLWWPNFHVPLCSCWGRPLPESPETFQRWLFPSFKILIMLSSPAWFFNCFSMMQLCGPWSQLMPCDVPHKNHIILPISGVTLHFSALYFTRKSVNWKSLNTIAFYICAVFLNTIVCDERCWSGFSWRDCCLCTCVCWHAVHIKGILGHYSQAPSNDKWLPYQQPAISPPPFGNPLRQPTPALKASLFHLTCVLLYDIPTMAFDLPDFVWCIMP